MKGVVKKRMWVVLGKKKKEERGKGNDWIPLGSEPVQLNNGSAEQYWLGWWGGRWQYAYCCSLSDFCCRRLSTLRKEFSFQPASWAINPTTCWSQRNCLLPFANLAPLKNKNRRGAPSRRCSKGCLQMLLWIRPTDWEIKHALLSVHTHCLLFYYIWCGMNHISKIKRKVDSFILKAGPGPNLPRWLMMADMLRGSGGWAGKAQTLIGQWRKNLF